MTKKQLDIPGNARESALQFQQSMLDLGLQIARMGRIFDSHEDDMNFITSLRLRPPGSDGQEWLSVVAANQEGRGVVGFTSGDSGHEVLRVTLARLENRTMKWKVDQYANQ